MRLRQDPRSTGDVASARIRPGTALPALVTIELPGSSSPSGVSHFALEHAARPHPRLERRHVSVTKITDSIRGYASRGAVLACLACAVLPGAPERLQAQALDLDFAIEQAFTTLDGSDPTRGSGPTRLCASRPFSPHCDRSCTPARNGSAEVRARPTRPASATGIWAAPGSGCTPASRDRRARLRPTRAEHQGATREHRVRPDDDGDGRRDQCGSGQVVRAEGPDTRKPPGPGGSEGSVGAGAGRAGSRRSRFRSPVRSRSRVAAPRLPPSRSRSPDVRCRPRRASGGPPHAYRRPPHLGAVR